MNGVILFLVSVACGYSTVRNIRVLTEIKDHRRVLDAMFAHARAWPLQVDHYHTWIITDNQTAFMTSKVAYETEEQAGLMGYTIWRDYARHESREWEVYVLRVSIEATEGDGHGNMGLNGIALDRTRSASETLHHTIGADVGALSGGGGAVVDERAGVVDPVEPTGPG